MTATRLFTRTTLRISSEDSGEESGENPGKKSGEDAADFLQGLVTSDVRAALPAWAGLLTPQGKVLFDFIVWPSNGDLLIDCEADAADALAKRLALYRLRRRIAIERDDTVAIHWRPHIGDGAATDPRLAALGERWIAPADPADESADAAWLAHRLGVGVAEGRAELGEGKTLWLECNAAELNGVSFSKGCYVGQENTARMNWRQKVNRRLIVVPLDRSQPTRRRAAYPELGKAVDHLRVEDIAPELMPKWLQPA